MTVEKILLVDDDPDNLKVLYEILASEGYDLSALTSGERALKFLSSLQPDLILLDVAMPGLDGFEVCRLLKRDDRFNHIPVMFITGHGEDVRTGFEVGGVDYLVKPIRREELLARVRTHLRMNRLMATLDSQNRSLEQAREQLETRVIERTRELSEMYGRLQQEVVARRQADERLQYLARHDFLTNLLTRTAFEEELGNLLMRIEDRKDEHVLLYMDLDQFKLINDTCGHVAGDRLLCQVAELLQTRLGPHAIAARLGGDDFAVVLCHVNTLEGRTTAEQILRDIEDMCFVWNNESHSVSASIGMVSVQRSASGVASLLSLADTACYAAKEDGRNRVHVYDENLDQMQARVMEMRLAPRLTKALAASQFDLYRQTIRALDDSHSQGEHYEVLIRLSDHHQGLLPPANFLGAAERFGVMPSIDRWVIERVFRHFAEQPEELKRTECCAINLSGLSLGIPHFETFVIAALERYSIPPDKICFEITETVAMTNLRRSLEFIRAMKNIGCRFSLDDFGSGVSSFLYLKNLPVDYLKIDGGFVRSMPHDSIDVAMVRSINDIGHVMGKKTIAEYVENPQIEGMLREMGVDFAQGYDISKPRLFIPAAVNVEAV